MPPLPLSELHSAQVVKRRQRGRVVEELLSYRVPSDLQDALEQQESVNI